MKRDPHLVKSVAPAASRSPSVLPARLAGALPVDPNPNPVPTPSAGAIAPPAALTMRGTFAIASDGWLATRFSFSMRLSRRRPPPLPPPPPPLPPPLPALTDLLTWPAGRLAWAPAGAPFTSASKPRCRQASAGDTLARASGGRAALLGTVLPAGHIC